MAMNLWLLLQLALTFKDEKLKDIACTNSIFQTILIKFHVKYELNIYLEEFMNSSIMA